MINEYARKAYIKLIIMHVVMHVLNQMFLDHAIHKIYLYDLVLWNAFVYVYIFCMIKWRWQITCCHADIF